VVIRRTQQLNDMHRAVRAMDAAPEFVNLLAQSVLDGVADAVMVIGPDYRVIAMNETARLEHFGKGPLPETVFCYEISHHREEPCSSVDHLCPMIEALTTRKPVAVIHNHLTADGTEAVFEILAAPVFDEEGVFMYLIETNRDVTHRMRAEKALKESETQLRTLYEFSIATGRDLEMDKLLHEVLNALIRMDRFCVESRAVLFHAEERSLQLAAVVGLPETIRRSCNAVGYGECHCGMAAEKGDVLILRRSECEERRPIACRGVRPHGHLILPFKTGGRIAGVLCLHTGPDTDIDGSCLELLHSIGIQLGIAVKRARLFEEMKLSSLHDPLTGLGNRRYMKRQIDHYINAAKRYGRRLSLVMLDIDHFKCYNDTYGHVKGDMVLSDLAVLLRGQMRDADQIFRYGGEEFLIMLPETDLHDACIAAERLRKAVEREGLVTISLGVASYDDFVQTSDVLITNTDTALYVAKQKGRNRVEPCCLPMKK
jgi:diguanylate cyclase (GGDEF)-like protein